MKSPRLSVLAILLLVASISCSSNTRPSVRVRNERATKANVQFKDASGNTTNINEVSGGSTSSYSDIPTGAYTVTAVIQNEAVSPTTTFTAVGNESYTLVVLAGATPTLRVDRP